MGVYGNVSSFERLDRQSGVELHWWRLDQIMARKKISTTVYITPEQNEALHILHTRTKVPVAVYIREGIDLVLKRYADQLPGQLSLVDSRDKK